MSRSASLSVVCEGIVLRRFDAAKAMWLTRGIRHKDKTGSFLGDGIRLTWYDNDLNVAVRQEPNGKYRITNQ